MLKIVLVFAELERNMTSERVTATMISRANNGKWNGGRVPFGYSYDSNTSTFSIREDEAAICRILKDTYLDSKSLAHTSRVLNDSGYKTRGLCGLNFLPFGLLHPVHFTQEFTATTGTKEQKAEP